MTSPGDVRVAPARLSDAAVASTTVADTVRGADVAAPVRDAGSALPGSGYGAAAHDLAARWGSTVSALADALTRHSQALSDSANAYQRSDHQVVDDMRPPTATAAVGASSGEGPVPGAITRALG